MNIFDFFTLQGITAFFTRTSARRPSPADFRRGKTKAARRILGILPDPNSKHIGTFTGGIVPMKRRFKGVSRTHGRSQ